MRKITTALLTASALLFFTACGGSSSSSDSGDTTPPPTTPEASLIIPVNETTVERDFTFLDENVLVTTGCVKSNLYDDANIALDIDMDTEIGIASQGDYTYIGSSYQDNDITAYAIVYATSMNTVPETLIDETPYALPAGGEDIKKLVINETETLVVTAPSSAHVKVYDSDLNFVDNLFVTQKQISIGAGTYYLLLKNGSCVNSTEITVNIL